MRRHVQEVPRDLPHARLYLDDIETVTRILTEEVSQVATAQGRDRQTDTPTDEGVLADPEVRVLYRIGQEEMDSIDDLLTQGGSVADFEVRISGAGTWLPCSLRFHWASPTCLGPA